MSSFYVTATGPHLRQQALALAAFCQLPWRQDPSALPAGSMLLVLTDTRLELRQHLSNCRPVYVDFLQGHLAHRRQFGGGGSQLIARAVGLKHQKGLRVLDLTAGLGQDGFVLACCGCSVHLLERHPVIYQLLRDGFVRAHTDAFFQSLHFDLSFKAAQDVLSQPMSVPPDVIYLDPMYPTQKKSAEAKKEMIFLRRLVGDDQDAAALLAPALSVAHSRVVVKRARLAPVLAGLSPDLVYHGKSSRFDVYLCKKTSNKTTDKQS